MVTIEPVSTHRGRRTWVAVVLSVLNPTFGMMYLGREWRALFYFIAPFVLFAAILALAATGHWKDDVSIATPVGILNFIGIVDCYRIARRFPAQFSPPWFSRWYGIAGTAVCVVAFILCLRGFVVEPYRIPSGAMIPTLRIGDFILVKKWRYGVRMPFVHSMLIELGTPRRGDVIVFRYPFEPSQYYVKRVVGLPGDRIQYVDRALVINGGRVEEHPTEDFFDRARHQQYLQFDERLGDSSYRVIYRAGDPQSVHPANKHTDRDACTYSSGGVTCTVPPRCYFVLGDNRDNSEDSRHWGFVPDRNIAGKVFLIWWNERSPERSGTTVP